MELQDRKHNELSHFATAIIVAAGVLGQAFLYMVLGISVEDVPVATMIILWVAISGIAKEVLEHFL